VADSAPARRWLVVTLTAPSDAPQDALVEGLFALGATSVEERGSELVTFVPDPGDVATWLTAARRQLAAIAQRETVIAWRWQDDEDWSESWKRGLRPRRVGRSFIVAPSWTEPEVRAGDRVIVVDPEMAFGTGEHATTRGALRFLEQATQPGARILDVGTGSAILAIGAALLGAAEVIAIDSDADAILNARDNVARNAVAERIRLEHGLVDSDYLARAGAERFDIIVANVLSGVLRPLLPDFRRSLKAGGHLILGGILEHEAADLLEACALAGFDVIAEDLEDEWWGVLLQRPAPELR